VELRGFEPLTSGEQGPRAVTPPSLFRTGYRRKRALDLTLCRRCFP
jgi:hypothetical protein